MTTEQLAVWTRYMAWLQGRIVECAADMQNIDNGVWLYHDEQEEEIGRAYINGSQEAYQEAVKWLKDNCESEATNE